MISLIQCFILNESIVSTYQKYDIFIIIHCREKQNEKLYKFPRKKHIHILISENNRMNKTGSNDRTNKKDWKMITY